MDNVTIAASIGIALAGDNSDQTGAELGATNSVLNLARGVTFSDGSGSGQCDQFYHDQISIAGAGTTTLVFNDGTLTDVFGDGVTLTKIKLLYIKNADAAETLTVGAAAANPMDIFGTVATDTIEIPAGGEWLMTWNADGLAVDNTKDELKIARAAGAAANVDIIVAGVN